MAQNSTSNLKYEHLYQFVMIGDSCVGKTAMIQRFRGPKENWDQAEHVATIGVDFVKKVIEVGGKRVLVQTWDTAG